MKLRTRLVALGCLGALLIAGVTAQFLMIADELSGLARRDQRCDRIMQASQQVSMLVYEYLLHGDERPRRQLALASAALARLIGETAGPPPPSVVVAEQQRIHRLLAEIDRGGPAGAGMPPARVQHLAEQAMISAREVYDQTRRWRDGFHAERDRLMRRSYLGSAALIALAAGMLIAVMAMLMRSVVQPVERLRLGVAAIARGEFAHRVPEPRADHEVGQLAAGFNRMAAALEHAEADRRRATALERSNRSLEEFAALAAHDLQAPLRTLTNFADLLERRAGDGLDQRCRGYLGEIAASAKRMRSLIDGLLRFSRASQSTAADDPVVPADEALTHALGNLAHQIEECGARIEADRLPQVRFDPSQLAQILQNLIGNALTYRHPERSPVIGVRLRERAGGRAVIAVRDNGSGIDAADHERIFIMFQRLAADAGAGHGIGLALCRRMVEARGGRIWVESALGEGATFCFSVPVAADGAGGHADARQRGSSAQRRSPAADGQRG